ncbi:hypothetical protein EYF80_007195 [Liparis tanakae]|uniref:Uncharacterized protein n=1 Tax=Liparis tanakae TaxID=230148 RepID=A0A4Z2IY27_9TELE|nr:hypothetical protein EYF80_007195 [Liparis tanakae]
MVSLVIDTQSLRLQGIRRYGVASFLPTRYRDLDVRPDSSDTAQSTRSGLWGGRPVGSVKLQVLQLQAELLHLQHG